MGTPKNTGGPPPGVTRHLGSRAPVCRDHAPAHPPPAGTARKLVLRQGTKSWPARPVVGNLSFGASEDSIRAFFETHGPVTLRLVPAQAPCLQRLRSPKSPSGKLRGITRR